MGKNKGKKRRQSLSSEDANVHGTMSAGSSPGPSHETPSVGKSIDNPLLVKQANFFTKKGLNDHERHEFFSPKIPSDRRAQLWMDQADIGEELVNQYAWATPDPTAIRILKEFSPLVEIGCGSNAYWCHILRQAGVDIIGYDVNVTAGGKIDSHNSSSKKSKQQKREYSYLKQGGPEVLASSELQKSGRTLFLCYPDEDDEEDEEGGSVEQDDDEHEALPSSMGWQCLHKYIGDHVIHVGETFLDSNYGMEQAPWGRSSSPEFQQRLASEFHCILKVELPNWLHTRDTISVWKRSTISTIVFAAEDEDDEDEEVEYRHIPREERLPMSVAAPCLAHLLVPPSSGEKNVEKKSTEAQRRPTVHAQISNPAGVTPSTESDKKKKKKKKRPREENN